MTDPTEPENQFVLHDELDALLEENASLRETLNRWERDYARLQEENARLRDEGERT
jgi:predicted nuclease with TOPRIM domain